VLVDFGIALLAEQPDTLKHYGSASYMAPEQTRGEKVDGSADIYSFGKMIVEVWGSGDGGNTMPKPLAKVVRQMLETEPGKRPALDTVKAALEDCCRTLKA